jgi:hypothetical protein
MAKYLIKIKKPGLASLLRVAHKSHKTGFRVGALTVSFISGGSPPAPRKAKCLERKSTILYKPLSLMMNGFNVEFPILLIKSETFLYQK